MTTLKRKPPELIGSHYADELEREIVRLGGYPSSQLFEDLGGQDLSRAQHEARLLKDLEAQSYFHHYHTGSPEQLQEIAARIQASATQLNPTSPEVAILQARREMELNDLAVRLLERARLPEDPLLAPDPDRTRTVHLERRILDAARELEPENPREAIARALAIARQNLASDRDLITGPTPDLDRIERQLPKTSRRLERLAMGPEPSQQQRVQQDLVELRRIERLETESRNFAQSRSGLPHRGNVREVRASLEALGRPRSEIESSLERVFRRPAQVRERLDASYRQNGELATLQEFARDPAYFGRLRGRRLPFLGDTRGRTEALEAARMRAEAALSLHNQRGILEDGLAQARSLHELQTQNRELAATLPRREELLCDLGRHMEGLEIHEIRPLLQSDQAKLVQEVRRAEQEFLEPMRQLSERFLKLEARGAAALSRPAAQAQVQKIALLFQGSPEHILKRLAPPQMQAVLVATALARAAVKTMTRRVSV